MRFFPEVLLIIIGVVAAGWCVLLCPNGKCKGCNEEFEEEEDEDDLSYDWRRW